MNTRLTPWEDVTLEVRRYPDVEEYDFQQTVGKVIFGRFMPTYPPVWIGLPHLHQLRDPSQPSFTPKGNDQSTHFHEVIYSLYNYPPFVESYRRFMHNVIGPRAGEEIVFQKMPTFRIHPPDQEATSAGFHKDSDFGHTIPGTKNVWVPLTDAYDTNALYVQRPGEETPAAVPVAYQNYLLFDAVNLNHGSVVNKTSQTRLSFDSRVVPARLFQETEGHARNSGKEFRIGDLNDEDAYYSVFTPEERKQWKDQQQDPNAPVELVGPWEKDILWGRWLLGIRRPEPENLPAYLRFDSA